MGKKRVLLLVVLAFTLVATCLFIGCGGENGGGGGGDDTPDTYEVVLDNETMLLTLGDEGVLIAEPSEIKEGATLTYTSSDPSVVSVDNLGKLTALKTGTATITVRYGEASATCLVTVDLGGLLPSLQMTNVTEDELYIDKSTEIDLSCTVSFNGKTYEDVTVAYELSDDTVGEVENGKFKPLASGVTEISVIATWRGMTGGETYASLKKTITIEVVAEFVFMINDGATEITIYTQGDGNSSPFVVTATYDGEALATTVEITEGSDYIEYDATAQTVTSKGVAGEAEITVTYTLDGENVSVKVPVHVLVTVYNYDGTVENFSAMHGDVATGTPIATVLGTIFGADEIVSVVDADGTALELADGKLNGVKSSADGEFESAITAYAASYGYRITLKGYTGILTKAEDFAVFNVNAIYTKKPEGASNKDYHPIDETKPLGKWEGYYVLANDIDASGYEHAANGQLLHQRGIQSGVAKCGFFGTFDGCGHTVTGMTIGDYGLFGYLVNATVKNVAFVDVTLRDVAYATVLSAWVLNSTISNVYISVANDGTQTKVGAAITGGAEKSTFVACIFEMDERFGYTNSLKFKGSFAYTSMELHRNDATVTTFTDVYVISTCVIGYHNDNKYYLQANNETLADSITIPDGFKVYTLAGLKKYASVEAMEADTGNTYAAFDAEYWTLEDGVPIWHSLYVEKDPELNFKVNGETDVEEITLHTVEDNSSPFVVTAKYGKNNLETSVEITSGNDYVEYDANAQTITSKGLIGEAVISVSFEINGEQSVKNIAIHVEATTYNYDGTITNFSAIHGDAITGTDFATAFGGNFTSAKDSDGTALTVENNKVYGVKTSKDGKTEKTITLYNNSIGYTVAIEGYSGIFTEMADFEAFSEIRKNFTTAKISATVIDGLDASKLVFDGYYVLANDIDAGTYVRPTDGYCTKGWAGVSDFVGQPLGLTGTFDGQGHVISNLTLNGAGGTGLFELINGGTVKNLALTNLNSDASACVCGFAYYAIDPTVENVYIQIDSDFSMVQNYALFMYIYQTVADAATLRNIFLDCDFTVNGSLGVRGGVFDTLSGVYTTSEGTGRNGANENIIDLTNVFAVSNIGFYYRQNKSNKYYGFGYAENERAAYVADGTRVIPEGIAAPAAENGTLMDFYCRGAYHYTSMDDLKAANHDFTAFSGDYWTIVDGVPVWKGLNA